VPADLLGVRIFGWSTAGLGNGSFHYRIHAPLVDVATQGLGWVRIGPRLDEESVADVDVLVVHAPNGAYGLDLLEAQWHAGAEWGRDRALVLEYDDDYLDARPDNPIFGPGRMSYEEYQQVRRPRVIRGSAWPT